MKEKNKKRKTDEPSRLKKDLIDLKGQSVADIETKDLLYQPKSDLTAAVYGLVIKFVRKTLGFQPNSIINVAADEAIRAMKDPSLDEESRRFEIDKLLSPDAPLSDDDYNELCNLSKKINDWDANQAKEEDDINEQKEGGVGIVYSDASSDEYLSEVRDSDDDIDLDEMFEKAEAQTEMPHLNLTKWQLNITPKLDIEPIRKEGYHEYHIQPKKRSRRNDSLIRIDELSATERPAFGDYKTLNLIQSAIYKKATSSDTSLLICAPTGAGKTNIALLTMLREIQKYSYQDGSGFDRDKFKIIYVAPIKALVQEVVENLTKRLGGKPYNLRVEELTGDHQLDQRQISRAQIIVCTPEKWDIVTRKSMDRLYTKLVRLVIFDEIHLLHNERGATLESLVARIKRHKHIEGDSIRIIGLSATLPNYKDVARFIAPGEHIESSTCYFDSTYRPIPLRQQYIALTETKQAFRMINDIVYEKVIDKLAEQAQILIFVHSRPDTFKTADYIKTKAIQEHKLGLFISSESAQDKINEYGKGMNSKLKELLQFGLGTHHAGMTKYDRSCVEELFRGRYIKVLVSTATLAWGVNLPARTVIIKGTQVYRDGQWTDLDSLDVTQMLGRAGRPGYDKEGEGIVITQQSQVHFYMSLMTEQLPVESRLIGRLAEFINAECVIGNIESLDDAITWLSETYLSSRMSSLLHQDDNRQYLAIYGIDPDAKKKDPSLTAHKHNLAYMALSSLDDRGLIVFDRSSGAVKSLELGRIASHYNCSSKTIKLFYDSIHEHTSDIELFRAFSLAEEFKDIFVRRGEEVDLQALLNQVPYPIDDKRSGTGANKVNALLQVYIFRMNIEGSDLICDMHFIKENAARLARAIHEIVLMKRYALVAELSLDLCRKIDKRMTSCHTPLRQFSDDLDMEIINKLEKKNHQVDELKLLSSEEITDSLRCSKSQGEKVHKLLKLLPKLIIEASVKPISQSTLKVDLRVQPDFTWSDKYHGHAETFWLLVEDVNQEVLLHHEMIHLRKYRASDDIMVTFFVNYLTPVQPFYFLKIFPDRWFGCDRQLPVHMEHISLPNDPSLSTQPLDLEPLTIRALESSRFEKFYEKELGGANFNQIQTQVFKHIYLSDEDVILLAPTGSGKTTCAELAIIRTLNIRGSDARCAYIAANRDAASVMYDHWSYLFGKQFKVVLLTGNRETDLSKLDKDNINIVIGDPSCWHILSLARKKKHAKLMSRFHLFVIDDIHMLYTDRTSIIEWTCSKIKTEWALESSARIVALGHPLVSAESLKNWLTFKRTTREPVLFNYPPSVRLVKLDLTIQKFHHYDYKMRLMTMQRPIYRHIINLARTKPVLIFVPDYRQTQEVCEVLTSYARRDGHSFTNSLLKLDDIREPHLKRYLKQGIGFLHRGVDKQDQRQVELLFENRQIQVMVVTVSMAWAIRCRSYLTIVMDTQQHNGMEPTNYELTDLLQMVGLTGRPLVDHECKCIILCHAAKASFYERYLREPMPLESHLAENLMTFINYEIAMGALSKFNNIYKSYVAHTFLYKRIALNPNYYGIIAPEDLDQKSKVFGAFFNELVNKVALDLEKSEFIAMEGSREEPKLSPLNLSRISLEYHISQETISNYARWLSTYEKPIELKTLELIDLISVGTAEFKQITVKHGELSSLKSLQRRHRPREGDQLHDPSFKIKLLILSQYQKTDGKEDTVEGELVSDRYLVVASMNRLLMAIIDIAWLEDSYSLVKTALQLSKKTVPFARATSPNIDMNVLTVKEEGQIKVEISVRREDDAFSIEEFEETSRLPDFMYREEHWWLLVYGKSNNSELAEQEKFLELKRIKTPIRGENDYILRFSEDSHVFSPEAKNFSYDLYLMSDFYPSREDRKWADLQIHGDR